MSGVLIDRILSVWVKPLFYSGDVFGFYGSSLNSCVFYNCLYDSKFNGVYNKKIYAIDYNVEYISSDRFYIKDKASMGWGLLKKNGDIIIKDAGELGVESWDWFSEDIVQLYNVVFGYNDIWLFSYEKLTGVETPVIELDSVPDDRDVIVDGLVDFNIYGDFITRKVVEDVIFGSNGVGFLSVKADVGKGVVITDVITGKRFTGVFLDEYRVSSNGVRIDRGVVEFYVKMFIPFYCYKVFWKGSDILSDLDVINWVEVSFLDIVPVKRYNKLKVLFYGDVEEGFYFLKGLYLRILKGVDRL